MKNNRLLLFAGSLLMPMVVMAGPRSFQQAKAIAEKQAALLGVTIDQKAMTKARKQGSKGEITLSKESYYVFPNANSKGFTIVSGDDRLPEIVGYSSQGSYDENNLPEGFISFMKAYQNLYNKVNLGDAEALKNLAEIKAWRNKIAQKKNAESSQANASAASTSAVAPLLGNIEWDQTSPYNNMCPRYDSVHVAATGCVATAMAQVMAYYKYPKQLKADIPGYVNRWNGIPMEIPTITREEGIYDWDNMLPKYNKEANATQQQKDAVAKLMYHCGAAVQMNYGPESAASVSASKLAKYFGYDADLMMDLNRSTFSLDKWMQIIDTELAAGRPVLYGGQASDGGHQFICDGKDGEGLYHINWGWSGSQNGYFDLSLLNPEKGGTGSGSSTEGYNRLCSMTIGIAPDNGVVDAPLATVPDIKAMNYGFLDTTTKDHRLNPDEAFDFWLDYGLGNQTYQAFSGYVALGILQKDGSYRIVSQKAPINVRPIPGEGMISIVDVNFHVTDAFEVGTVTLCPLYSKDGENWTLCDVPSSFPSVMLKITKTKMDVISPLTAQVTGPEKLETGAYGTFQVTLSNLSDLEYFGYIDVSFSDKAERENASLARELYVSVPAHGSVTRSFNLLPKQAGDFYLWLDELSGGYNRNLVDAQKFTVDKGYEPPIYLVETSTNAEPGLCETELAFYGGKQMRTPRVNGEQAEFTYKIKNDGEDASILIAFAYAGGGEETTPTFRIPNGAEQINLPGNGEVTTITRSVTPEEAGSNTICGYLLGVDENYQTVDLPTHLAPYVMFTVEGKRVRMNPAMNLVYVSGSSSGISSIEMDASGFWDVYTLSGQKIKRVAAGSDIQRLGLPSGIYVVNHQKVLVK